MVNQKFRTIAFTLCTLPVLSSLETHGTNSVKELAILLPYSL